MQPDPLLFTIVPVFDERFTPRRLLEHALAVPTRTEAGCARPARAPGRRGGRALNRRA